MSTFKQYIPKAPGFDAYNPDIATQQALGSDKVKTIKETGTNQSGNYKAATSGWRLTNDDAEFNVSTALASLDIPDTTTANSFHVENDGDTYWGANVATGFAGAPASISKAGAIIGSSVTITGGAISGTPISSIPNSTVTDISLLDFTHDLVFSVTDKDTVAWALGTITLSNGRTFSITGANTGNMSARTYIYLDTAVSSTLLQTTTTVATAMGANKKLIAVAQNGAAEASFQVNQGIGGMKLTAGMTSISNNDWNFSGAWSVTDADTVAWGAGTLTTSNGGSYSITGSNTGNMAAKTYVYFDLAVSATAFQLTTTAATAIGDGKILVAICQNGTGEAKFIVVNDNSYNIDAANIVAGSITANEIAATTITASNIAANTITANELSTSITYAGTIVVDTGGAVRSGQTAFDTGTGFFLGTPSGTSKFSIGNSSGDKITWDGTTLTVNGVSQIIKSYTTGEYIYAQDSVFLASSVASRTQVTTGIEVTAANELFGKTTYSFAYENLKSAQSFLVGSRNVTIGNIGIATKKVGNPSDNMLISIQADSSGAPSGVALATATEAGSGLNGDYTAHNVDLDTLVTLTAATTYWVVFERSGSTDDTDYYGVAGSGTNDYANGTHSRYRSSWSNTTQDLQFSGVLNTVIGNIYITHADTASCANSFIGFVKNTTAFSTSTSVAISGEVAGFSGLTVGGLYYLSNTIGTISTSAGTVTRKVGIATSATTLLITNIW